MSVPHGSTKFKDANEELIYEMDWDDWLSTDASIATSTWTITGDDAVLTKDNPAIVSGDRQATVRLLAGTSGQKYKITNKVVTDETPTQTGERSFYVKVRDL